jgi:predicted pyridoxine 5'-phosphate oxidase superfamily flavin-nucleotide-binding protein
MEPVSPTGSIFLAEDTMRHKYLEIASTPSVKTARAKYGSAKQYARLDGSLDPDAPVANDRLTDREIGFIAERDSFYIASVSETGWPYVQFRGGPPGFLRVLDERTLGYADFRGNRQYITTGNVARNDRVSLFLMDYANRRRLKMFGRVAATDADDDPELAAKLTLADYPAQVERAVLIKVQAFDWNCPQHITPRFTEAEIANALAPIRPEAASCELKTST